MLQDTTHHARHGSNRFEHHRAMAIPASEKSVGEEPQKYDDSISNPVGKIPWFMVSIQRRGNRHFVLLDLSCLSSEPRPASPLAGAIFTVGISVCWVQGVWAVARCRPRSAAGHLSAGCVRQNHHAIQEHAQARL
jgi:hypothetical protein